MIPIQSKFSELAAQRADVPHATSRMIDGCDQAGSVQREVETDVDRRLFRKAGLAAARARGRSGGRPKMTFDEAKVVLAKKLHADKTLEIDDVCKTLRISRSTFYRYVRM